MAKCYETSISECIRLMYRMKSLTIHDITVTSLLHVSTQQCHLQGVHTNIKTICITLGYIHKLPSDVALFTINGFKPDIYSLKTILL